MVGLFGILNLGTRSLQTQRQGVEVAGHNLANVNNPAYARQRLSIQTSLPVDGQFGPQGTGADAMAVVRLRSNILDDQIQSEVSVRGSLEAQQSALQYAQANLGQQIDRLASGAEGAAAAAGVGRAHSLADELGDLFNAFQSFSSNPTSMAERQSLLMKATNLTSQFNQVDQRLGKLTASLNESVKADVGRANELLGSIAKLNEQIRNSEAASGATANDLRDLRQQKIEDLAKLVKIDLTDAADGTVALAVAGTEMVTGGEVVETLQAYDSGQGKILVRGAASSTALTLTGGSIQGTIEARDGAVAGLRTEVNAVASLLINEVNVVHATGFGLTGSTGEQFFSGTNAADIQVNARLASNPALLQASADANSVGDNRVALALAQLAGKKHASLDGQTFSQKYSQAVGGLGQALSGVNTQLSDQQVVEKMFQQQRDSMSGVSLDEEMADLTKFQKAFAASARLVNTVDGMLDTIVSLGQ
ncbi:MAG: flagellar hook-associated protein FlgK [Verrucomicrobiales bacterium]|nr:flagellar hook-associated protein FlgK [Verrucomicrobiales bacterium]